MTCVPARATTTYSSLCHLRCCCFCCDEKWMCIMCQMEITNFQQNWSRVEALSRILDNNYLRWYLLYLNKRNKDSQQRTLPPEMLTNSIGLDFLSYLLQLICQCSVFNGFVTRSPNPCHASPNAFFAHSAAHGAAHSKNQQLLFSLLYMWTYLPTYSLLPMTFRLEYIWDTLTRLR